MNDERCGIVLFLVCPMPFTKFHNIDEFFELQIGAAKSSHQTLVSLFVFVSSSIDCILLYVYFICFSFESIGVGGGALQSARFHSISVVCMSMVN